VIIVTTLEGTVKPGMGGVVKGWPLPENLLIMNRSPLSALRSLIMVLYIVIVL
jgi:hypothetical protein